MRLFGPSREEVWTELCRQIGAEYLDRGFWKGGGAVNAHVGPWTKVLDIHTVSTGKATVLFTRLRAPYINHDGFRFTLARASLFNGSTDNCRKNNSAT